jgi:hypothetical protein
MPIFILCTVCKKHLHNELATSQRLDPECFWKAFPQDPRTSHNNANTSTIHTSVIRPSQITLLNRREIISLYHKAAESNLHL